MTRELNEQADSTDIGHTATNAANNTDAPKDSRSSQPSVRSTPQDGRKLMNVTEEQEYAEQHSTLSGHNLEDAERERQIATSNPVDEDHDRISVGTQSGE